VVCFLSAAIFLLLFSPPVIPRYFLEVLFFHTFFFFFTFPRLPSLEVLLSRRNPHIGFGFLSTPGLFLPHPAHYASDMREVGFYEVIFRRCVFFCRSHLSLLWRWFCSSSLLLYVLALLPFAVPSRCTSALHHLFSPFSDVPAKRVLLCMFVGPPPLLSMFTGRVSSFFEIVCSPPPNHIFLCFFWFFFLSACSFTNGFRTFPFYFVFPPMIPTGLFLVVVVL